MAIIGILELFVDLELFALILVIKWSFIISMTEVLFKVTRCGLKASKILLQIFALQQEYAR
jgi:hypothetical protein